MHEDFVDETLVEFEIEGKKFKYKPVTSGEENDRVGEYTYIQEGVVKQDVKKLNELKLRNITSVPYSKEDIKNIIGVEKEWNELNQERKWNLFKKLKPSVFSLIITQINSIDSGSDVKKNSSN